MLVRDRMTPNPVTISPDTPVLEALELMKKRKVRRLPVVGHGKLLGIVAESDLLKVSPSPATSLSIYEIHYLISKMAVKEAMTRNVITIRYDRPVEEAALLMRDHRIGCLPVEDENGNLVGIITETDLFDTFIDLMGLRIPGSRLTIEAEDRVGFLADITGIIKDLGFSIISVAVMRGHGDRSSIVIRVNAIDPTLIVLTLEQHGFKVSSI